MYPQVSALAFNVDIKPEYIPAICVWERFCGEYAWLVLDERDSIRDKTYTLQDHFLLDEEDETLIGIYQDWTGYLESQWTRLEGFTQQALLKGLFCLHWSRMMLNHSPHIKCVRRLGIDGMTLRY